MSLAERPASQNRVSTLQDRMQTLMRPQSIQDAFRRQVEKSGSRAAMVCGDRELSYWALDARSDAIARKLVDLGAGRGTVVGLFAPRGPETIAAMIGILKAGATYLPFDPTHSARQLRYICDDAAPALMLVQDEQLRQSRVPHFWNCPTLDIGPEAPLQTRRSAITMPVITAEDLACVLYTAPTSGQPRGVQIPHRALLRFAHATEPIELGAEHVTLQLSPLAHDAANFEIWGALLTGGKLAIVSPMHPSLDSIADTIARHGVTTAWLNAGVFHQLVDHRLHSMKRLRQLILGGDIASHAHVEIARQTLTGCRIISAYGPTEGASLSCCYVVPADVPVTETLPIGQAVAQTQALVLDEARRVINDDREGELYLGGAGLAHGYLNRSQFTTERFTHAAGTVQRVFRTGDRVRRRPDGNLEVIYRGDRIVRTSGKRIDLDRVEAAARRSGIVHDVAVIAVGEIEQRQIAAFVTPPPGRAVSTAELRGYLTMMLPDFSVPTIVQAVDTLPLASSGRVDRAALAERVPAAPARAGATPVGTIEAKLLRIFREVLGSDSVGMHDNFFDAGGTSLQLEQAHAMIRVEVRRDIALMDLFTYPKVSALAAWINKSGASRASANDASIKERGWRQTLSFTRTRPIAAPGGDSGVPF
jgi:amino acid adenylation domain-containing protein